ncbi:hypothetical protein ACH4S8_00265 [Streptomyces sp. NPDC021080]|uniref:hypothetical protein n=1 Tax=Streptomyces sp. NPDC021080 TaxID=3365110 RepID=UPI00378A2543
MPHSPHDDGQHRAVSADFQWIVQVLDPYVTDRTAGSPRRTSSREHRLPALLLARMPDGGAVTDTAEPDPGLTRLVRAYAKRLQAPANSTEAHLPSLAPHAVIDDAQMERGDAGESGQHVRLLEEAARQLRRSMPDGAGRLRLPEFDTVLTVLRADIQQPDEEEQRQALRDLLCDAYARRFKDASPLAQLGEAVTGWPGAPLRVLAVAAGWVWRRWYGIRLDRQHLWVGRTLDLPGRSFLDAALSLQDTHKAALAHRAAQSGHAQASPDEEVVREVLLTALIHDLAGAARPRAWSRLRPRRAWAFVLLLPTVGGEESACRRLLDTYDAVVRDIGSSPLLVLGAATDTLPSYAAGQPPRTVPEQGGTPGARRAGRAAAAQFRATIAVRASHAVHVLPVPRTPDNGTPAASPATVAFRSPRVRDWWRPVAAATAAAMLCAGGIVLTPALMRLVADGSLAASCRHLANGEVVGLTDGNDGCDLANDTYAADLAHKKYVTDLKELEKILGRQNAQVDTDQPYRTVVFFAPLSVGSDSKRTAPIGFQTLRGALLAQKDVNDQHLKVQVPVRLLVANAGEYFRYGSRGGLNTVNTTDADVSQMIIDRADRDHVAAVMGLAQSRPESQQAAIELGDAGITVLGTGVSGQRMLDGNSPVSYFQLSPPDARIADVMAGFARNSPELQALTDPAPGRSGPAAIVVYDPTDTYFSADLAERFEHAYRSTGPVRPVVYKEASDGHLTQSTADTVCSLVQSTKGFVLYAGRAGVMEDLFLAMQRNRECRGPRVPVPVLAESPAPDVILHPSRMTLNYYALRLFYNQFSLPVPDGPFGKKFGSAFHLSAENDAALGYDAVSILSSAMNAVFATDGEFSSKALVTRLQDPGIQDYAGESGVITLDSDHHYPPNKEIHVREIIPDGKKHTDLTCGLLSQGAANATHWGPGDHFDCPTDPIS